MDTYRKSALFAGIFYILATLAGLLGVGLFSEPALSQPDFLARISNQENQVILGALFELIMAVAVVGVAIAAYPVLRRYSESIAIGYVGARIVEALIFIVGVVSLLVLLTLSREFVAAGTPDSPYFHTLGELLLSVRDWGGHVILDVTVFPLGALIFYALLFQTRLVPRWLSAWGILGAFLYWAASLLVLFASLTPLSPVHIGLQAPLGLQEMALAIWLIVKGFNPAAAVSPAAKSDRQSIHLAAQQ